MKVLISKSYWSSTFILAIAYLNQQYKNSFLGSIWGLIPSWAQITVMAFVFTHIFKQPPKTMIMNLSMGIPLWNFLSSSLVAGSRALISRESIIKKVIISRTIFPVVDLFVQLYNLVLSLLAMYIVVVFLYPEEFSFKILLLPIIIIPFLVSVYAIAIAMAFITPYLRDMPQLIQVSLSVLYWSIPIVYPYSIIPESQRVFFEMNPLFILFRPIQTLVIHQTIPDIIMIGKYILVSVVSLLIAYVIHKMYSKHVVFYL